MCGLLRFNIANMFCFVLFFYFDLKALLLLRFNQSGGWRRCCLDERAIVISSIIIRRAAEAAVSSSKHTTSECSSSVAEVAASLDAGMRQKDGQRAICAHQAESARQTHRSRVWRLPPEPQELRSRSAHPSPPVATDKRFAK